MRIQVTSSRTLRVLCCLSGSSPTWTTSIWRSRRSAGTANTATCSLLDTDHVSIYLIVHFSCNNNSSLDNFYRQSEPGYACIFSLKNPSHPEFTCLASCGVMCVDMNPQHPHMVVTGLHDGNVAVYNLQLNTSAPVYQSSPRNGKHRDVVWQVVA